MLNAELVARCRCGSDVHAEGDEVGKVRPTDIVEQSIDTSLWLAAIILTQSIIATSEQPFDRSPLNLVRRRAE